MEIKIEHMYINYGKNYVLQDISLHIPVGMYGLSGDFSRTAGNIRKDRVGELLEQVNLEHEKNKRFKNLSGGMKRRLGIAQALLNNPEVLIIDEPTAGLDPEERVRFYNLLSELAVDRIILLSIHIAGDIEAACSKTAV